eukprot:g9660.t1
MDADQPSNTTSTPPRAAPAPASNVPAEIPPEFKDQRVRHKEYKLQSRPSGRRFTEEDIGETRTALSSRFLGAAEEPQPATSAPPPPPPPPPPAAPTRARFPQRTTSEEEEEETAAVSAAATAAAAAAGAAAAAAAAAAVTTAAEPARAPAAATATTAPATTRAATAAETLAGERPEDALGAPTASEPRTSNAGDAGATKGDSASAAAGASASGEKRKVGPGVRERGSSESPRKAALSVTASTGTSSFGEKPPGRASPRTQAEAEAEEARPQAEKGSKREGAGATSASAEGGRRETPDHARRTWKAYHERQALVAEQRQYSRPVKIDPVLWGDLLSGKLVELIEGERNHPRTIVSGGAADRDGDHCLLPELDAASFHSGHDRAVAAAVGKPKVLHFSDEGSEYTADDFGARGDFNEMYKRRYSGFDGRFKEARGHAAERAWSRAGHPHDSSAGESNRARRSRERMEQEAQSIPWDLGTNQTASTAEPGTPSGGERKGGGAEGGRSRSREGRVGGSRGSDGRAGLTGSFGDDLFADDAASALAAGHEKGGQLDSELQPHPSPHIGPDTHCLIPEEVELVHKTRDEERADGSNASLATQMQHRLVSVGRGAGGARKLRGTAARERQEQARIVMKDRYLEEAVRRNRAPFTGDNGGGGGGGDDDDDDDDNDHHANSITSSVTKFEAYYIQSTQAVDALPTVERGFNEEQADAEQPAAIPGEAQVLPAVLDKGKRRAERRAERAPKLQAKRDRAKRATAPLDSEGSEAPSYPLSVEPIEGVGGGSGFVDVGDEISLAPSISSLGSFGEERGGEPQLVRQQAHEADATGGPLPAFRHLPPALAHTAGKGRQAHRRRSTRSIPLTLPRATTTGAGIEEDSAGSFPPTDNGCTATVDGVVCAESECSSSPSGIAFGVAAKRRRSSRLSSNSSSNSSSVRNSAVGVRLAGPLLVAAVSRDVEEGSVPSAASLASTKPVGAAGAPASSNTTAIAAATLLKRKIDSWRSRSKPPPKAPHRSPALTVLTGEDWALRGAASSSAPSYSRASSDGGGGRPGRDGSTMMMTPSAHGAISAKSHHQLPAARGGVADDDQTLAGSVASSLTSLGGSVAGLTAVGPLAETDSSVASLPSTSLMSGSGELTIGERSVTGSAASASLAATEGSAAGFARAGAGVGVVCEGADDPGSSGGTRVRLDVGAHVKSRETQSGRGGAGSVPRVHKIHLGSKRHQKVMQPAERTALLIGACEWGDLSALERLLGLGASPLDPYSPSVDGSRCVFCQFFLFVLQVGAGLRPRLAPDDSLHTRALAMLIDPRLADNPRFLSIPKLRDQDDRGFCLLHHAAAFGNASKVEFLLERGVDPDVRAGGDGETALLIAARRGQRLHLRVAAALIRFGASMLARDRKGMTALHRAAAVGRKHMCHYLLLVGADKSVQDNDGRTPLDLCHGKHPRVSAVLRSFVGCKPPPATILDYMEKVEVQGLEDSTAQDLMLQEKAKREEAEASEAAAAVASAADAAAAADTICGDDANSMTSWDSASIGGMSGDGASVLSLGTMESTVRRRR